MRRLIVRLAILIAASHWLCATAEAQLFGARSLRSPLSRRSRPGVGDTGVLSGNERFVRGNRRQGDFVGSDSRSATGFVGAREGANQGRVRPAAARVREQSRPNVNTRRRQPGNNDIYDPKLTIGFNFTEIPPDSVRANLLRRLRGGFARKRSTASNRVSLADQPSVGAPAAAGPNRHSDGLTADSASRRPTGFQAAAGRFGPPDGPVPLATGDPTPFPEEQANPAAADASRRWRIEVSVEERTARLQGTVASADDRDLAALIALFEPGISAVQNDLAIEE